MVDVQTEIRIMQPIQRVSEYAANPDNAPEWYKNIKTIEWKTPKPLKLGSRIAFVAHFLGKRLEYVYEIIALVPGKKLVMKTASGPFPMETIYTWESLDANITRMTLRNRGNPTGFSKIVSPVMEFAMRRANKKDLLMIKRILEEYSR